MLVEVHAKCGHLASQPLMEGGEREGGMESAGSTCSINKYQRDATGGCWSLSAKAVSAQVSWKAVVERSKLAHISAS